MRARAEASSSVGCPAIPPALRTDKLPQAQARRTDSSNEDDPRHPIRKPASKLSPAPTVSTTSGAAGAGISRTVSPSITKAPLAPIFTTTTGPREAMWRAALVTSSIPVIRTISSVFGRKKSHHSSASSKPPSHPSVGSQFGSIETVIPRSWAVANSSGSSLVNFRWR